MAEGDIEMRIQQDREKGRKQWDHPISFILAAVGSAVGLGNVWRFPNLVSQWVSCSTSFISLMSHLDLLINEQLLPCLNFSYHYCGLLAVPCLNLLTAGMEELRSWFPTLLFWYSWVCRSWVWNCVLERSIRQEMLTRSAPWTQDSGINFIFMIF